ncbi:MAG: TlyA family RNA methyltransferase [Vicinamibacterales bacterium]
MPCAQSPKRERLDVLVVGRGLAPSRERARRMILAGLVLVDGRPVDKAGANVEVSSVITLAEPDHPYVGRGGLKLAHALDTWAICVEGFDALDIGASTGGFTDVLLKRGARRVVALDVGRGQLDWTLRNDPRVVLIEGVNARNLSIAHLPGPVDIVTIDVSFISLKLVLPRVPGVLSAGGQVVALVKPQFEARRGEVGRGGLVRDPAVHGRVVAEVSEAAERAGLVPAGVVSSPVTGGAGNREFLLYLRFPGQRAEQAR